MHVEALDTLVNGKYQRFIEHEMLDEIRQEDEIKWTAANTFTPTSRTKMPRIYQRGGPPAEMADNCQFHWRCLKVTNYKAMTILTDRHLNKKKHSTCSTGFLKKLSIHICWCNLSVSYRDSCRYRNSDDSFWSSLANNGSHFFPPLFNTIFIQRIMYNSLRKKYIFSMLAHYLIKCRVISCVDLRFQSHKHNNNDRMNIDEFLFM